MTGLYRKLKELQNILDNDEFLKIYNKVKIELASIYDHISERIRTRNKCDRLENGEKIFKFFLNLQEYRGAQSKIRKLISGNVEIVDELKNIYQKLYGKNINKEWTEINTFLDRIENPKLSDTQIKLCEKEIAESDLYTAMKSMANNERPGNDGLTEEFHKSFLGFVFHICKRC